MKNSGLGRKFGLFAIGLAMVIAAIFSKYKGYYPLVIYVLDVLGALLMIASVALPEAKKEEHRLSVKEMSMIGVQGAIAALLYIFVKFNLPIFPSFLDIQISEIPALITAFAYGPFAGCMVILVRFFIKLPFTGTAGVGEVADLLLGFTLVVIAGLIYKKKRTFKRALIGTGVGIGTATAFACLINWLILIPFYLELYFHGSMAPLIGMCSMIPGINEGNFMPLYIFVGVLPFNLLRYLIVFVLTFVLYKRVHFLLDRITKSKKN